MTIGRGPGRPPKIVPKATEGRKAELERLRGTLWAAMEGASARDTASIASQLRAIASELSSYEPEPEHESDKMLREMRERRERRMREASMAYSSSNQAPEGEEPAPEPPARGQAGGGTGAKW